MMCVCLSTCQSNQKNARSRDGYPFGNKFGKNFFEKSVPLFFFINVGSREKQNRRWTLQTNIIIYVSKVRRRLLCIKRSVALSPIQ